MASKQRPHPREDSSLPPFELGGTRFDLNSYSGRFQYFLNATKPLYCFAGEESIAKARAVIETYKMDPSIEELRRGELWEAQELLSATVHPQTQKPIFPAFRVCAFVPVNVPIIAGMLLSAPTLGNTVFWQWFNQSYNACFNYANGNHSEPRDVEGGNTETQMAEKKKPFLGMQMDEKMQQLLQGYVSAVGVSVGLAVTLGTALKKAKLSDGARKACQLVVPYTAVAGAGMCNAVLMRRGELYTGIDISDADGRVLGKSKNAAQNALTQVAISRAVLPIPCLALPAPLLAFVTRLPAVAASPLVKMTCELLILTGCIGVAVPMAMALYPQQMTMSVDDLEPEFRGQMLQSTGEPIKKVFVNKGL